MIMDNNDKNKNTTTDFSVGHLLLRILITAIIVGIAAALTPGFSINNLWSLILASIVIALLDYLIQRVAGVDASPFGRGLTGFIISAIILYVTKLIVPGFNISVWGAIIGAIIIGILDAIIPGRAM
mgnify:CR=1 FL=1|jgi:putative membrane protein